MNGFGTTETLMATLNLPSAEADPCGIGKPLPGVTLGLKKREEDDLFGLSIKSIFQSVRTLGEENSSEFFETGDLVQADPGSGQILYAGRRSADFIKDEYGVKIPLGSLREYYSKITGLAEWIEWIPLVNMPGLAGLIFIHPDRSSSGLKELAALLKSINDELKQRIEPFEFAHRHLERLAVINDELPRTRKGTVSKSQIFVKYGQTIEDLRNQFVFSKSIETVETAVEGNLYKYSNPYLAGLLEALKIDREYTKGEGDFLFCREGSSLQRVTDLTGGFGAGLLGHDHPAVRDAVIRFLDSGAPALNNQGSSYHYPSILARELNRIFSERTGKYFKVVFANSGAEATEIAIHHAYFEWRAGIEKLRDEQFQLYGSVPGLPLAEVWDKNMQLLDEAAPSIIVAGNCFHGYSSGSRSLLDNRKQRSKFCGLLKPEPLHVDDTAPDWKEQAERYIDEKVIVLQVFRMADGKCYQTGMKISRIIASVIEPVRGEGGIREVNPSFADYLATQKFPLISDEIQCGLGRTGLFPAYKKAS
ncbi:MAG: aminotransferase class III-fold pyridoxal phosphate-dependent enzyme, partial [Deltaproteobacteria bacterium]